MKEAGRPGSGGPWETRVRARSYELDSFGHVNHAVLLSYLEHARFQALEEGGFSADELERRGWGVHLVRVEADYRREVRLGDVLVIRTRVESIRRTSVVFRQEAFRDGPEEELALEARIVAVWVGETGRPVRVPPEARRALGLE